MQDPEFEPGPFERKCDLVLPAAPIGLQQSACQQDFIGTPGRSCKKRRKINATLNDDKVRQYFYQPLTRLLQRPVKAKNINNSR
jgi:hypothetical protein